MGKRWKLDELDQEFILARSRPGLGVERANDTV